MKCRWKPQESDSKTAAILVSVCSNGDITYWHAPTGKSIITISEDIPSDLYALDFSKAGDFLAGGGKDYSVKIYDDSTKSLVMVLHAAGTTNVGHSNRVFSVKFTDDPNILLSGGWDNTV
jgi:WD40 repeat protein